MDDVKQKQIVEYYKIVEPILNSTEFQKKREFKHHGDISLYEHSLKVSFKAYMIALKMKDVDPKRVAIGGLLHDFYSEPWPDKQEPFFSKEKHCFLHAHEALINSQECFTEYMDDVVEDIIERHMYPINNIPPKYKESWLITVVDKIVSLEVLKQPKFFKRNLGIKKVLEEKKNKILKK